EYRIAHHVRRARRHLRPRAAAVMHAGYTVRRATERHQNRQAVHVRPARRSCPGDPCVAVGRQGHDQQRRLRARVDSRDGHEMAASELRQHAAFGPRSGRADISRFADGHNAHGRAGVRMTVIALPARPKNAYNPNRPASALLLSQVEHLEHAVGLPEGKRRKMTEGEAARYIGELTEQLFEQHRQRELPGALPPPPARRKPKKSPSARAKKKGAKRKTTTKKAKRSKKAAVRRRSAPRRSR